MRRNQKVSCGSQRIASTDDNLHPATQVAAHRATQVAAVATSRRPAGNGRRIEYGFANDRSLPIFSMLAYQISLCRTIADACPPSLGCDFGVMFWSFAAEVSAARVCSGHCALRAKAQRQKPSARTSFWRPCKKRPQPLYSRQPIRYAAGRVVIGHGAGAGRR
jgi:hypothetical protein